MTETETTFYRLEDRPVRDATWHWRDGCRHYRRLRARPRSIRETLPGSSRPGSGELCNLCLADEDRETTENR